MSIEPVPDWMRRVGGFSAEDLDTLPGLPPHTELIDGGLVLMSPQRAFHTIVISLLDFSLRALVPQSWRVRREMSIILDDQQRPEPDLSIIDVSALGDGSETFYPASATLMVIEVVSPESRVRDRDRKPQLYARAGIRHFWRVEEADGKAVVYVYELDPATSSYALTGIHHDQLKLSVPFDLNIDLTSIAGL